MPGTDRACVQENPKTGAFIPCGHKCTCEGVSLRAGYTMPATALAYAATRALCNSRYGPSD
eukprot:3940655-Rhodomonas_salina.3